MKIKILIVYQFATFGGVERVILNRAEALKYYNKNYKLYIYFYEDYGAKIALEKYIEEENISDYIEIVNDLKVIDYDYVVSIDTPKLLEEKNLNLNNIIIESHTFESKYRTYLNKYRDKVKYVIVPSKQFKEQLEREYAGDSLSNLKVLPNFVPWDIKKNEDSSIKLPSWNKNIIFYFGRMDENKNIKELIKAFKYYLNNLKKDAVLVLIGGIEPSYELEDFIKENQLYNKVAILPPVNFNKVSLLLNTLKNNKAVFVSSSKGESFSLSAAEAISKDIPCILSDIQAHKNLVENNIKYLYPLGDYEALSKKIVDAFNNYDLYQKEIQIYKNNFSAKSFVGEWDKIFEKKE